MIKNRIQEILQASLPGILGIFYLVIIYGLFRELLDNPIRIIIDVIVFSLMGIVSILYFVLSKKHFIIQTVIFIITNSIIAIIGFDIIFTYILKVFGTGHLSDFISLDNLEYIGKMVLVIIIVSIISSVVGNICKYVMWKIRLRGATSPNKA